MCSSGDAPTDAVTGYDLFTEVLAVLRVLGFPVRVLLLTGPDQSMAQVVANFDAADCLLFCSRYGSEGSPTVVKEATAMGLPVISVDVGDLSQVLARVTPRLSSPSHSRGEPTWLGPSSSRRWPIKP